MCVRRELSMVVLAALALATPIASTGVSAHAATLPKTAQAAATLEVTEAVHHHAAVAVREPMVVTHPGGALFVAGYTQAMEESLRPPKLFRSDDGGRSWSPVDVGTPEQGAVGNSDVDLAVGPDGTLYFLTMGFDRTVGEGTHVAVGVSRDAGSTWTWTDLTRDRLSDRPWIGIAPDGTAHVIWNDGEGVRHVVSADGGNTWTERDRIHPQGGSSHLAVGPAGEIAVRITPVSASGNRYHEGVDLLAVSHDGGTTWSKQRVPGERDWAANPFGDGGVPRWVEPLAWDAEGSLYSLWSEGADVWLARSRDGGDTWTPWRIDSGDSLSFFPYLVARGDGELAATWFTSDGEDLRAHVVRIDARTDGDPDVIRAEPILPDSWAHGDEPRRRDPAGEYLPVVFLDDGDLGLVVPIQNAPGDRNGFSWYRLSPPADTGR